jgi:hypothetical protein
MILQIEVFIVLLDVLYAIGMVIALPTVPTEEDL